MTSLRGTSQCAAVWQNIPGTVVFTVSPAPITWWQQMLQMIIVMCLAFLGLTLAFQAQPQKQSQQSIDYNSVLLRKICTNKHFRVHTQNLKQKSPNVFSLHKHRICLSLQVNRIQLIQLINLWVFLH